MTAQGPSDCSTRPEELVLGHCLVLSGWDHGTVCGTGRGREGGAGQTKGAFSGHVNSEIPGDVQVQMSGR